MNARSVVALAVRVHERNGAVAVSSEAFSDLRAAAAQLGQAEPGFVTGPSAVAEGGTLVLPLASPEAVLAVVLALSSDLRPLKTTYCAAVVPAPAGRSGGGGEPVEVALMAADRAATLAASGVAETDPRDSRIVIMGPERDRLAGALIDLIIEAYDSLTDRQRQMVALIRQSETQQQVARHLGISRQAVNQSLAAARWLHLERAESAALRHLASLPAASGGR